MSEAEQVSVLENTGTPAPPHWKDFWRGEMTPTAGPVPLSWAQTGTAFVCGLLIALTFPGFDAPWAFTWVGLVPLCILAFVPRSIGGMALLFASWGAGFFLTLLYWFLAMHPLTWLGFSDFASLGVVVSAWSASSAVLITQFGIFGALYGFLSSNWRRPGFAHAGALAIGWTCLEWLTSLGTFGFTWGNLALSQVASHTFIQILDIVGPFPLAGAIVAVNGFIALSVGPWLAGNPHAGKNWRPVAVALGIVCALGVYGAARLYHAWPKPNFSATIVQGNIAGAEKWTRGKDAIWKMANKYLTLSNSQTGTNVLLWPETAMPEFFRNNMRLVDTLRQQAIKNHRAVIFGTLDWEGAGDDLKLYNAVAAIDSNGLILGFDYKRHLVPYGEYVPGRAWMPQFMMGLNIVGHDYFPGTRPHLFELGFTSMGAGVCYDGIFPDAVRPVVLAGASSIALVTNDAWYKDTAAPRVLLAHAALRAVENRRWVLRAANTGISAFIDPTGAIISQTPVFVEAVLRGEAASIREQSIYTRWGDWASQLASAMFFVWIGLAWTRRKRPL